MLCDFFAQRLADPSHPQHADLRPGMRPVRSIGRADYYARAQRYHERTRYRQSNRRAARIMLAVTAGLAAYIIAGLLAVIIANHAAGDPHHYERAMRDGDYAYALFGKQAHRDYYATRH